MPVWDLLLPERLYPCLMAMLVLCVVRPVFLEMAFGQYASLRPVTIWKPAPLFKGNVIILWYTNWCSRKWLFFSMPVWDLLLSGRLYLCLKVMLFFCGVQLVFMEMAFGQYASLGPITIWKIYPCLKVMLLFGGIPTGVQGNGISSVCQSGTYYYLEAVPFFKGNVIVLW